MEMLSMGPGRRIDDALLQSADASDAEPVDPGVRSRPEGDDGEPLDLGQPAPDTGTSWEEPSAVPADHWLAGLVRPEVLGVSAAALLLLIAFGLPFMSVLEISPFATVQVGLGWIFAPTLIAAAVAAALGLGGLRQAAYHGAATWARITSGGAAVVGLLVAAGTALTWFIATQSELFEQLRGL